jgi:hypothetical protein
MQWVGAILGFFIIVVKAAQRLKDGRMSIEEARRKLDEIERGGAS